VELRRRAKVVACAGRQPAKPGLSRGPLLRTLAVVALRVVVVQHGEKDRLPGDPGLTRLGQLQARATARWLAGGDTPVAILSSPMRRARETTTLIAEALGVPPITDPRLRERMNWDDPLAESVEDFLRDWRVASADRAYVPRSGDSSAEAASRFLAALDDLAITHPTGTAILVAHGDVTTDALRTLLGDDELRARAPALIDDGVPSCAITTLHGTDDGWTVASIAATDHQLSLLVSRSRAARGRVLAPQSLFPRR
jgi:broad specificity phosphatase PhoE